MKTHVVSLELAKQLKEAGWTKPTEFWWTNYYYVEHAGLIKTDNFMVGYDSVADLDDDLIGKGYAHFSAPLATEILGEIQEKVSIQITYSNKTELRVFDLRRGIFFTDTLPNCFAKLWLLLKQENLL